MTLKSILFLLIVWLCTACQPAAPALPLATATRPALPTPAPFVIITIPPPESLPTSAPDAVTIDHVQGPDDAVVTIVSYGDFQCEACAPVARDLNLLRERYPDTLRIVWRHLPDVGTNDKAELAATAAEAASEQDQFWAMHDLLFARQQEWAGLTPDEFRAKLNDYAAEIGMDAVQFTADMGDPTLATRVEQSRLEALALEIVGIPSLLVNGRQYSGRYDLLGLDAIVQLGLLNQRHYSDPPGVTITFTDAYQATLITEKGDIVIELLPDKAPGTVNNFVFLAQEGWYDGITFHRVIPGKFAQTGDPSGTGFGGPGYSIADEENDLNFDALGWVGMADIPGIPDSGGSQFFITTGPLLPSDVANGNYTIFGRVISGMDVVESLTARNPFDERSSDEMLPLGDDLIRVEIMQSDD